MAEALVGGAFLSASLQVLFDRLASREVLNIFQGHKLSDALLKKLKRKLLIVNAVLNDEEAKQFTNPSVKEWVDEVKAAVYDAENILDEIATEALRFKMEPADSQTGTSQVGNQNIESRAKEMVDRLEEIIQDKDALGLKEGTGERVQQAWPSTSLVDESCVFGRDDDKEKIIELLKSADASGITIDVISIVGMGGIGKTTLAQCVYNDPTVEEMFDLKAWVFVSEEFQIINITKSILEGTAPLDPSDRQSHSLDLLQVKLKESLLYKKFLLVLDDVWNEDYNNWDRLQTPLLAGAKGSKIIITTRSTDVATAMNAVHVHCLGKMSFEDSWLLFKKHVFRFEYLITKCPQLEEIGRKMVDKCQGLPLAIRALGSLLHSKVEVTEWEYILNSEVWNLPNAILPALRVSYFHLPLHLRRCFAYCSIFPKGYNFKKENLILLWMAEGFLQQAKNKRMEEVGELYFDELCSKSFFEKSIKKESCFVMHDLIHDLAQFISGEFCFRLEDHKQNISENCHHLGHCNSDNSKLISFKKFEALTKVKDLRTFLGLEQNLRHDHPCKLSKRVLYDVVPQIRYLRVLSLRIYQIIHLPDAIGNLKHLRYLDLSYSKIRKLPQSVCSLYNLQTIILSGCKFLIQLPSQMRQLINLRYLDITDCVKLTDMPSNIGELKCLQRLTNFIVGEKSGLRIGELRELSDIRGTLRISKMQNVVCKNDAFWANMKNKKYLEELELEWDYGNTGDVTQNGAAHGILDKLQPHWNLKRLSIESYKGSSFPNWLGDPSFLNLASLELDDCAHCTALPPLGHLPSLKHLSISHMLGIEKVGGEFYGNVSSSVKPSFPSLQTLEFSDMLGWKQWLCCEGRHGEFPSLQELHIINCPKLIGELPRQLGSLKKLYMIKCSQLLEASLGVPAICKFIMADCGRLQLKRPACDFTSLQTSKIRISGVSQWKELPSKVGSLSIRECDSVETLLEGMLETNTCLVQYLEISRCCFSRSLNRVGLPTTLKSLCIVKCAKLELFLPELLRCHHPMLERLLIRGGNCHDSLSLSFSLGIFPRLTTLTIDDLEGLEYLSISISEDDPTSLSYLNISGCSNLVYTELPALNSARYCISKCLKLRLLKHTLSSLQRLSLGDCPELLFQKDGLPLNLSQLEIGNCSQLMTQMDWGLQRLACLTEFKIYGGCEDLESFPKKHLLPLTLTSLQIVHLPNLKSLDSKGLQQLTSLTELSIYNCPKLQFISEEGFRHLPSLIVLEIVKCPELQSLTGLVFQHLTSLQKLHIGMCPALQSLTGSGLQHLTSLKTLDIWDFPRVHSFKDVGLQYLTSLERLQISSCATLQSLVEVGLQHLISLETLSISHCPKLQYLTKEKLPTSLSLLEISNCPFLEQRFQCRKGQDWHHIAHIPHILIDDVLF